jgi:hypothetical protein
VKTSTKMIGITAALVLALCTLACGSDTEAEGDCISPAWSLSLDGADTGNLAVATRRDSSGLWGVEFANDGTKVLCSFISTQPVASGIHDGFSCTRTQGATQDFWLAKQEDGQPDLRPHLTITKQDSDTIEGTIEGIALQIVNDSQNTTTRRYMPFQMNFRAAYGGGNICGSDGGSDITAPVVKGCTTDVLRSACKSTASCMISGVAPQEMCASATDMIALPSAPDVNACVKAIEFMRDSCL